MAFGAEEPLGGAELQILKIQGWCWTNTVGENLATVTAILALKLDWRTTNIENFHQEPDIYKPYFIENDVRNHN